MDTAGSLGEAVQRAADRLRPSRTAALDAQLLMAHVAGRDRAWVFAHSAETLAAGQQAYFDDLVDRRMAGEPLAYIRGSVQWYDLELSVSPAVLVPRPDTEVLLETAAAIVTSVDAHTVVDIGTGSGALAIGLARLFPSIQVVGVDVSSDALQVARSNVDKYRLAGRVTLVQGSLLAPVEISPDVLVANLPYLSTHMMDVLDRDVTFEPVLALHAGETGLEMYRLLLRQARKRGWSIPMLFEIDPRQRAAMKELILEDYPNAAIEIVQDYSGLDRVVLARRETHGQEAVN